MTIIITGSQGNIGKRLRGAFEDVVGIDRVPGADIVADIASIDFDASPAADALAEADGLIHLATSADPDAPDEVHFRAVADTARLVAACARHKIPRLVLPSSDWAEPRGDSQINTYGQSKRVFESMAKMYAHATGCRAVALRFGWVPGDPAILEGADPAWLENVWDDARLIAEVKAALGL
jgi:nucleoside-diphosphate-sugar epimerase